jgi:BTB/POZ domain-containing protein 1/2
MFVFIRRFLNRFIVDHPIFVLGFGLYGSVYLPAEYSVFIELIHTPTNKVLGSNDTTFSSDGSTSVFRVMFEEPIQVLANNSYTASATIKVSINTC